MTEPPPILLEDARRIVTRPGDLVVFHLPPGTPDAVQDDARQALVELFEPREVSVILLTNGIRLAGVFRDGEASSWDPTS